MRRLVVVLVLAAAVAAWAGDPAPKSPATDASARTCSDGKLVDPRWSLSLELLGLAETDKAAAPQIFVGQAGDIEVEILVIEGDRPAAAAQARDEARRGRAESRRKVRDEASGDDPVPWTTYVEQDVTGLDRLHGFGYQTRGLQTFVVHAFARAPTRVPAAELARAATALRLGEDRGASLCAMTFAASLDKPADSVDIVLRAAHAYSTSREESGLGNPAMAERVLEFAIRRLTAAELTPEQAHGLHERLGIATLLQRKADAAIGWFSKAVDLAAKTKRSEMLRATSLYNLACANAVAGRADDAFAALEKAFAGSTPVDLALLSSDTDLVSLHSDRRWREFVARRRAAEPPR